MKKYVFLFGFVFIALLIMSIPYSYDETINSNNIGDYIMENNITNIKMLCTTDFCDYLRSVNINRVITIFKNKYEFFLTNKIGEEKAFEVILKGFPITQIIYF